MFIASIDGDFEWTEINGVMVWLTFICIYSSFSYLESTCAWVPDTSGMFCLDSQHTSHSPL